MGLVQAPFPFLRSRIQRNDLTTNSLIFHVEYDLVPTGIEFQETNIDERYSV